jgi:hypothetical protein
MMMVMMMMVVTNNYDNLRRQPQGNSEAEHQGESEQNPFHSRHLTFLRLAAATPCV